jgi:beta-lactamase class A
MLREIAREIPRFARDKHSRFGGPVLSLAAALSILPAAATYGQDLAALRSRLEARIRESGAEVGLYYRRLGTAESLLINPDLRMHAASTMKVPVMIQVFRDAAAGRLRLDEPVPVKRTFTSIVDGSPYDLSESDDSDSSLYRRQGSTATVRELVELMITVSSNLATNILIEKVDARRVTATMRELKADSIQVRRGVEDGPAFRAGLNNTTTARDLGVILAALAEGRAAGPEATREMIDILARQKFNTGIPAGLPAGTRVAHKTGWITRIHHDAAIVYPAQGAAYVLVVLTRGVEREEDSARLIADLTRLVHDEVSGKALPRRP